MHLKVCPIDEEAGGFYENHGTYHEGDSGLDLFVPRDYVIAAGETGFIGMGVRTAAFHQSGGKGCSFLLMPRSSIAKTPLRLCNSVGLIDAGYRGEIIAAVDNVKTTDFTLHRGQRIVQIVAFDGGPISFEMSTNLDETSRGGGGLGSTDVKTPSTQESAPATSTEIK